MMPTPPDAPLSVRLGARVGPELVATILVVAVVVVAVGVALSGGGAPGVSSSPLPSSAAGASGSPGSSPTRPPSTPARALMEIADRLLGQRAALEALLAKSSTDAPAIADILREVNASLVVQEGPLAELATNAADADLVARIRAMNAATFDAVRRTQRASITNAKAYRSGAAEVVAALAALPAIRAELATLAGEGASGGPSQPAGTAPSGATP